MSSKIWKSIWIAVWVFLLFIILYITIFALWMKNFFSNLDSTNQINTISQSTNSWEIIITTWDTVMSGWVDTWTVNTEVDTKLFTEIYQYDLKELSSDLKKDINFVCDSLEICQPFPNYYQLVQSDDAKIQQFVSAFKKKKYPKAADLYNSQIWSWGEFIWVWEMQLLLLPYEYPVNYARMDFWVIPFQNGLLWIGLEWQVSSVKFFYATIRNNTLYWVRMNGEFYFDTTKQTVVVDDGLERFNLFKRNSKITNTSKDQEELYRRLFDYLQWKKKSTKLDERKQAFEKKVEKLFK